MSLLLSRAHLRAIAVVVLLSAAFAVPNIVHADFGPPPPPPSGPVVDPVSIASNNASSSLAMPGDVVTLSFTVDIEPLTTPSATIAGHDATVLSTGGNSWTASATMLAGDAEGIVTFSAVVGSEDASATTTVEAITSGPDVVFDETAPVIESHAAVGVEAASSTGATITYTSPTADDGSTVSCAPASGTTFALGTTTVTCNASDAAGNAATPTTFTATVLDTTAPVISLTGAASLTLTVGDSFTDEGATTADIVDGAGTADVSGSVNTSSAGTYTLTYDKTDAAGNHAAAVTRTVTVNPAPSNARIEGGGGSGGSLFPVAPVFGTAPPAPSSPPAPAPTAPQSTVSEAQTTNVPESSAAEQTVSAEISVPSTQSLPPPGNAGGAVAQARTVQAPVAETPPVVAPEVEPQRNAGAQLAASGLLGFSWWWILLLLLLVLGGGYSAWRQYRKYREQHPA